MGLLLEIALLVFFVVLFILLLRWFRWKREEASSMEDRDVVLQALREARERNCFSKFSAKTLARMIRTREASSQEIVESFIEHLRSVNDYLNAVVEYRFEEAIEEAKKADLQVRTAIRNKVVDDLPPLLGVPCTIKECFALTGMPNTSGLISRKALGVADTDATAVARLRNAGAIPLGVTNTSELCMWMETKNKVYGRTLNPHDPRRIVGGSSGGEGSIVGSGASPFGLGSDIGGSIRMPAFFNGVYGHKPTGGIVPGSGQFPRAENEGRKYLTTGPICRHPEDIMLLLQVLSGPDGIDTGCQHLSKTYPDNIPLLKDPDQVDISSLKVYFFLSNGDSAASPVHPDLKAVVKRCADFLAERFNCQVEELTAEREPFSFLKQSLNIWSNSLNKATTTSFSALLGGGNEISPIKELLRWLITGSSPFTLPSLGLCLLEGVPSRMRKRRDRFVAQGEKAREDLRDFLGENSIILFPPYPNPAPFHSQPIFRYTFDWIYTAIWNIMQVPVTQVPCGFNKEGVPLGVQVIAKRHNDYVTIAVANALDELFREELLEK